MNLKTYLSECKEGFIESVISTMGLTSEAINKWESEDDINCYISDDKLETALNDSLDGTLVWDDEINSVLRSSGNHLATQDSAGIYQYVHGVLSGLTSDKIHDYLNDNFATLDSDELQDELIDLI